MKFRFSLNSDLSYLPAAVPHPSENINQRFTERHQRSVTSTGVIRPITKFTAFATLSKHLNDRTRSFLVLAVDGSDGWLEFW